MHLLPPTLTEPALHSVHRAQIALQRLRALSSPPDTVVRLLEITLSERPALHEIVDLVRTDPGLAVEVLRRLQPEQLKRRNALHIPNAVHALGIEGLRELALRTELHGAVHIFEADEGAVCSLSSRKHSVAAAAAAQALAIATGYEEPEVAYAAGLLSSMGSLALWDLFDDHLPELRGRLAGQDLSRAVEVERQALGVDHETLAIVIAESWSLPAQLCDVVTATYRTAEQLEGLRDAGSDTELASLARASLFVAHYSGFPLFGGLRLGEPPADVAALLAQVERDALVARARTAVGAASEISRPLARTSKQGFESMRRTQDELRERLFVAEHRLRAEVAVNHVLNYGLNRLGDGDPIPGVMFQAMTSMDFSRMCAMEIDSAAAKLEVRYSVAASGQAKLSEGVWLPFPTDRAYLSEPMIVTRNDAERAHQFVLELTGVSSAVVAPLRELTPGKRLLLVGDRGRVGRAPLAGEERCLGIIAEQLTLLLRHEELTKEKERMATLDPLTGAATRRRLMDRLEYVITQSARTRMPFSLLIMDLDHFKKFNDTMGHQVGDRLLQDLVKVLTAHVRKGDLVARYGGEEFVVLLPNCAMKDALGVAEALRERVFDYGVSQREMYKGLPVSISMGAAQWTAPETALALIARADAALYASKHAGRNRVTQAA